MYIVKSFYVIILFPTVFVFIYIMIIHSRYVSFSRRIINTLQAKNRLSGLFHRHNIISNNLPKILLTLFTTFKDTKDRENIQMNTILNWALFMPEVQPVLYTDIPSGILIDQAKRSGWKIYRVPKVNKNNMPFVKEMYFDVQTRVNSTYYGFVNGDILFTKGLVKTLKKVAFDFNVINSTVLIIGRRLNVWTDYNSTKWLYKFNDILRKSQNGKLYSTHAEDYFFMSHCQGFPWKHIKDIVIGWPAWDNYLTATAVLNNITVIDATNTILAFHQIHKYPDKKYKSINDYRYNLDLIASFPLGMN